MSLLHIDMATVVEILPHLIYSNLMAADGLLEKIDGVITVLQIALIFAVSLFCLGSFGLVSEI